MGSNKHCPQSLCVWDTKAENRGVLAAIPQADTMGKCGTAWGLCTQHIIEQAGAVSWIVEDVDLPEMQSVGWGGCEGVDQLVRGILEKRTCGRRGVETEVFGSSP